MFLVLVCRKQSAQGGKKLGCLYTIVRWFARRVLQTVLHGLAEELLTFIDAAIKRRSEPRRREDMVMTYPASAFEAEAEKAKAASVEARNFLSDALDAARSGKGDALRTAQDNAFSARDTAKSAVHRLVAAQNTVLDKVEEVYDGLDPEIQNLVDQWAGTNKALREAMEAHTEAAVAAKEAAMLSGVYARRPEPPSGGPPRGTGTNSRRDSSHPSGDPNWIERVGPIGSLLMSTGLLVGLAASAGLVGLTMTNPNIKYQFMMGVLILMCIASGLIALMIGKVTTMGEIAKETYQRFGLVAALFGVFLIVASNFAFTPVAILTVLIIIFLVVVGLIGIVLSIHLGWK